MKLNRRNTLIGLGTIVAGGGAALGTGAFSQVEANRTVNVNVAGDATALLGLNPTENSEFVFLDDDQLRIDLENLNLNAKTDLGHAFTIINNAEDNGEDPIEIEVWAEVAGDDVSDEDAANIIQFTSENGDGSNIVNTTGTNANTVTLSDSNDSDGEIEVVIDTTSVTLSDGDNIVVDGDITFFAEPTN